MEVQHKLCFSNSIQLFSAASQRLTCPGFILGSTKKWIDPKKLACFFIIFMAATIDDLNAFYSVVFHSVIQIRLCLT